MDTFLAVLKFIAILSTGIWGIVGLLVNYRDDEGRITGWGRRALIGAVLSTIVAATSQGIETYKEKLNADRDRARTTEESNRTQTMLLEIRRGLYPIKDITAYASAEFPVRFPELRGYVNRLNKDRASLVAKEGGWEKNTHVTLPLSLHPNRDREQLAWRLLVDFGLEFEFYRTPINPSDYLDHDHPREPDLTIKTRPIGEDRVMLEIEADKDIVRVTNWNLTSTPRDIMSSSGAIISALDLYGSQVFVTFRYDEGGDDAGNTYKIMQQGEVQPYITLQVGSVGVVLDHLQEVSSTPTHVYVLTLIDKSRFRGVDLRTVPERRSGRNK
jgi:hypothetical protein